MARARGPNYRTCERCGKGCQSRGVRCPVCTKHCRRCDVGGLPRLIRFCESCAMLCPICDQPHGHTKSRRWCGSCTYKSMREVEARARERLGSCCARCGIVHPLQWDHVLNDPTRGLNGRKRQGALQTEYAEIAEIARTGQSLRLQLLCPNCNWLKEFDPEAYALAPTYGALIR